MKNVAITGVSGYLGTLLAKRLTQEAEVERIVGISRRAPKVASSKLEFYPIDVRKPFGTIFVENNVDTAIHFAFSVVNVHDERVAHEINIKGSQNFLDASTQAKVQQVFFLSSGTAYGAWSDNPKILTEDTPLKPNPDYLYSCDKAKVDLMFQKFAAEHPEIKVTIGRAVSVTGPGGEACGLTAMFLPIMVKAIGCDPTWQFIHEDDLVELIMLLAKQRKAGIYNFTADGALRYTEIIKLLGKPAISLPSWLIYWGTRIAWKLHLQSKAQEGALKILKYGTPMTGEKLINETGYKYRYTGPEAFDIFLQVMGKKKPGC